MLSPFRRIAAVLWLSVVLAVPASAQSAAHAVAAMRLAPSLALDAPLTAAPSLVATRSVNDGRGGLPHWVRWGLIGAAAGAVTFPLLGSMASDSKSNSGGQAVAGALAGFVIIGGGVALWDSVCGGDTGSRRAGLCGGR